ncbi:hypothetical protein [Actinomadura kijaniata]|uniref:hypothetical protein n=1 Tax=Actinomadura kijaniata TaxID=46161 RepID=UPI00082AFC2C|nr:hypothetical protein [Actinomadura kijaniata]
MWAWEYEAGWPSPTDAHTKTGLTKWLGDFGREGWELAVVVHEDGPYIFKRPRPTGRDSDEAFSPWEDVER